MMRSTSTRVLAVAGLLGCVWLAQGCRTPERTEESRQPAALAPAERVELVAAAVDAAALELRAGDEVSRTPLTAGERAELLRAAADATELEALRAGDLKLEDRELKIIGITAAVVLLIVIIA
ncbi:MAG: hypothetical protein FJ299_14495 [Planctomycetes bacterium]|nr:hypothetical protein [Planctomycetota bacterium]